MVYPGDVVIVHDPDVQDVYVAVVMQRADETRYTVAVDVRLMLQYPIQHSIIWPDVAHENAPVQPGSPYRRMNVLRQATPEEAAQARTDAYSASLRACLLKYTRGAIERYWNNTTGKAPVPFAPEELVILDRHRRGIIHDERSLFTIDERDL